MELASRVVVSGVMIRHASLPLVRWCCAACAERGHRDCNLPSQTRVSELVGLFFLMFLWALKNHRKTTIYSRLGKSCPSRADADALQQEPFARGTQASPR
eukprot:1082821-Rhodomonas_salina.1